MTSRRDKDLVEIYKYLEKAAKSMALKINEENTKYMGTTRTKSKSNWQPNL